MLLHLLRHAHAGDPGTWSGRDDERPLSPKGREQAERTGSHLAAIGFVTDAIITSPKLRARETAEIVGRLLGHDVLIDDRVGDLEGVWTLEAVLADAGDADRPIVVGHDPDLTALVSALSGAGHIPMRKGALARIEIDRPLRQGAGALRWLLPPDALRPRG
jgi:phosphohistidine phosphatase